MATLRRFPSSAISSPALTALGLGLLSTTACCVALLATTCERIVAQRPAAEGVLVVGLNRDGDLRLWNQPIRHQDLPEALERARQRSSPSRPLVVRLVPEPLVPWGVVNTMLSRLRPPMSQSWILQLQMP
jgi:hypothetical protein